MDYENGDFYFSEDDPSKPNPKKRRRLNANESKLLTDIFIYNQKPNAQLRSELGYKLNMTPRAVQIWYPFISKSQGFRINVLN
jgi:hypothetical protein